MFIVSADCRSYEDFLERFLEYQNYLSQKILEFESIRPTHAVVESLENFEIVSSVTNLLKTKGKISLSLLQFNIPTECGVKTQSFYVYFCAMLELNQSYKVLYAAMPTYDIKAFREDYESLLRQETSPHDSVVHVKMGLNIEMYANPLNMDLEQMRANPLSMYLEQDLDPDVEIVPKHLHLNMGFYEKDLSLSKALEYAFFYKISFTMGGVSFQDLKVAIRLSKKLALEKKDKETRNTNRPHSIAVVGERNFNLTKPKVVVFEEPRLPFEELCPCPNSYHRYNSLPSLLNPNDQDPASQPNLVCEAEKSATNIQEEKEDHRNVMLRRREGVRPNYSYLKERSFVKEIELAKKLRLTKPEAPMVPEEAPMVLTDYRRTDAPGLTFSLKNFFVEEEFNLLHCVFGRPSTKKEFKRSKKIKSKAIEKGFLVLFIKHNSKKGFDFSKTKQRLLDTSPLTDGERESLRNTLCISNTLLNTMGAEKLEALKLERLSLMSKLEIEFFSYVKQWHYLAVRELLKMSSKLTQDDRSLISKYLSLRFLPFDGNAPLPKDILSTYNLEYASTYMGRLL